MQGRLGAIACAPTHSDTTSFPPPPAHPLLLPERSRGCARTWSKTLPPCNSKAHRPKCTARASDASRTPGLPLGVGRMGGTAGYNGWHQGAYYQQVPSVYLAVAAIFAAASSLPPVRCVMRKSILFMHCFARALPLLCNPSGSQIASTLPCPCCPLLASVTVTMLVCVDTTHTLRDPFFAICLYPVRSN